MHFVKGQWVLSVGLALATNALRADPLDDWALRNPFPTVYSLSGIAWGNDRFIAIGDAGTVLTSSNGVSWTQRKSITPNPIRAIAYGNGTFVAVGGEHTFMREYCIIQTSIDGTSWTERSSGLSIPLYGVTYANGIFFGVGEGGALVTSPDGKTWSQRATGVSAGLTSVAFGDGTFVAVGEGGTVLSSTEGVTWTQQKSHTSVSFAGVVRWRRSHSDFTGWDYMDSTGRRRTCSGRTCWRRLW